MRRKLLWICLGFALSILPGCGPGPTARDKFQAKYACPADQIAVNGNPMRYVVTGCQHESRYVCGSQPNDSQFYCTEQVWRVYEATDGSHDEGWDDDNGAASQKAALASAAHDLPCAPGAIAVVGGSMLLGGETKIVEGCGQRLTYQAVAFDVPPDPRRSGQVVGRRYTLTGKVSLTPR